MKLKKYVCVCVSIFIWIALSLTSVSTAEPKGMSLDQKLGQMLCLDFRTWNGSPVTEINDEIRNIIHRYHIGSVILFSENFVNRKQTKRLINDLKQASVNAGDPPLLICVDQEGGRVERFAFGRKKLKNNSEISSSKEPEKAAFEKGKTIGRELADLGINCDLAPVVDVNSNPLNPIIGVRSFGKDAKTVCNCGVSFMKGLHKYKVASAAKHFPGHGDTSVDSHIGLPRVNKTMDELRKLELLPFIAMIKAHVDMVMTAHIEFPKVETKTVVSKKDGKRIFIPATLSKTILTDILRNKLKFQGVIITDAMNMKAISDNFGEIEAVKMAVLAGADMICMPVTLKGARDIPKLDNLVRTLKSSVFSGEIDINLINKSVNRICSLKLKI